MHREEKLLKNTVILGLGTFLPKFASFIILPILTGCLTKSEYGTYDLITILVSLFLPAVTLQIQAAAFRFLIDAREDIVKIKGIITNIFIYTIPVSFIALIILFIILKDIPVNVRIVICLYFIADILANTEKQIARGLSENKNYSMSAVLGSLGQLLFVFVFVFILQKSLFGAVLALSFATFMEAVYLFKSIKMYNYIDFATVSLLQIKEMLSYSWPMVPNSMSMWVMRVSDRLIITICMGPSANAVYAVANKIPSILTIAQNTFNMAWQENASIASNDIDADDYYSKMFDSLFGFIASAFAVLVSLTPILFEMLIQGDYDEAYIQIPILFLGMFFFSISGFLGGIYVAYKKTFSVGMTTMIAALCNLLINVIFINKFGLFAASGSTLISYIFLCLYRMVDIKKIINIKYNTKKILFITLILILNTIFCLFQTNFFNLINFILAAWLFTVLNGKTSIHLIRHYVKKIWLKSKKK